MFKKLQALIVTMVGSLTLLAPIALVPALAHAQTIPGGLNCGANLTLTDTSTDCGTNPNSTNTLNHIITLVINIFSIVVGLISVIMIIIGGIKFVLSGGDSSATTSARNTVLYAVVGLVVVAVAQVLVHYVLNRLNNAAAGS